MPKKNFPLTPLPGQIIVEIIDPEAVTSGGIIIPQTAKDGRAYRQGQIVAVGKGPINEHTGERLPMEFEVGEVVIFDQHAGFELSKHDLGAMGHGDRQYKVVVSKYVLAKVTA